MQTQQLQLKMNWLLKTVILLDVITLILHSVALILLRMMKNSNLHENQKLLLIVLCTTELIYGVVDIAQKTAKHLNNIGIIYKCFWVLNVITVVLMYMLVMTLLTIERFLAIYLNIKYGLLCPFKKAKIALTVIFIICLFASIPGIVISLNNHVYVGRALVRYIYPAFEICFIVVAIFTYFYITKQIYKHRRNREKLKRQLNQTKRFCHIKQSSSDRFRIFVPTLIVVTFLFFTVFPNILKLCYSLKVLASDFVVEIAYIMIPVGFIVDPVIYIFNLKVVRSKFRSILRRNNSVNTVCSDCKE